MHPAPLLSPRPTQPSLRYSRPGLVLAFTLVILILMSLIGMTMLLKAHSGLTISHNTNQHRNALASADTAARLATLIAKTLLRNGEVHKDDLPRLPEGDDLIFTLTMELMTGDAPLILGDAEVKAELDPIERYKWLVERGKNHHVTFKAKPKGQEKEIIWATADFFLESESVSLGGGGSVIGGASLGQSGYGDQTSSSLPQKVLVITVIGLPLSGHSVSAAQKTDDFYGITDNEAKSVITILYREDREGEP